MVRMGRRGRITIPAKFRRNLGLKAGDILSAAIVDRKIVLQRRSADNDVVEGKMVNPTVDEDTDSIAMVR